MNLRKKYVPRILADVVGAKSVAEARTLLTLLPKDVAIVQPYGSGKTMWASMFVRGIFCEAPADTRPCGACVKCS